MPKRLCYFFGGGTADGHGGMKDLLGGKGAGLAEMCRAGIPVPPGLTISTEACRAYYARGRKVPQGLDAEMRRYVARVEKAVGARFGDARNPLLLSVRSGARFSMPGMMDTILNLGLNDNTVVGLASRTKDPRFAYDCYRRFIMMFADVVMDVSKKEFEALMEARKHERSMKTDTELAGNDMKWLAEQFLEHYRQRTQSRFPQDPWRQLTLARDAVFRSWHNPRAIEYRRLERIPDDIGTACNVQAMVFGNMGEGSGTGVGFTRDPSTGEKVLYGEFLRNAQGEDVVAGVRTPVPIAELKREMPAIYAQIERISGKLEAHYRDAQDFEFTIQSGTLYMLQTRNAKRAGRAAVRIAVDLVKEKRLKPQEALFKVEPRHIEQLLHPEFDPTKRREFEVLTKGLDASPGAAAGKVVFDAATAIAWASRGDRVVLVRRETCPDDIGGMMASRGFLTMVGGRLSHAAVVARGMGKPAVVGAAGARVDEEARTFAVDGTTIYEGDFVSLDGSTGEVFYGDVPLRESEVRRVMRGELKPADSAVYRAFQQVMAWADKFRRLGVRANADTPEDARVAVEFGAEGIGLCRTEHMFFGEGRIEAMQEMILADTPEARAKALAKIIRYQEEDFLGMYEALGGRPMTVRTLDPPLHEFLPSSDALEKDAEIAEKKGDKGEAERLRKLSRRAESMHEINPMLGHRGCRLGITHPEITEMQARAILRAACTLAKRGLKVKPEIMIPLVGTVGELKHQKERVVKVAEEVFKAAGVRVPYMIGTMIEVPRGALTANEIAAEAEFFSFGTNDLTQMTLGLSRDDGARVLRAYMDPSVRILRDDPFSTLDTTGVGQLIEMAAQRGRSVRPDLKLGICGEHGGDPLSIAFCHKVGLNYVSCSPYRVPVARLAAAQAALSDSKGAKKK